jgi:hypothetical protein
MQLRLSTTDLSTSPSKLGRGLLAGYSRALVLFIGMGAITAHTNAQGPATPPRLYAQTSFWNLPIAADAPLDTNSSAIVANAIDRYAKTAVFANGNEWGVPVAFATDAAKMYDIACTRYCDKPFARFRVPRATRPATGSDHHLAVLHGSRELDLWDAQYDPARDGWSASTVLVNDAFGWGASCPEGKHCNGAVAAGFALLGGLVWPHELRAGRIEHALAITTPFTRAQFIACPATHTDGKHAEPDAIPEGARIQLDPTFNVDAQPWPSWKKTLARALQRYGAYIVDTGGALAIRAVSDVNLPDNSWAAAGTPTQGSLSELPWNRMRVLRLRSCTAAGPIGNL